MLIVHLCLLHVGHVTGRRAVRLQQLNIYLFIYLFIYYYV